MTKPKKLPKNELALQLALQLALHFLVFKRALTLLICVKIGVFWQKNAG